MERKVVKMIFRNLVLKNFKSHANTNIDFNPGITVIVGENGAGKSTIFEGISYALFRKTTTSQNDLVRSSKDNQTKLKMSVELTFEEDGVEYKIIREKSSSKTSSTLYIKNIDDGRSNVLTAGNSSVDNELKSIIKVDSDLFLNAIYIRQGEIADLVSKKPAERKKLITKLLKIEELEKAWDKMPQLISTYENHQAELKGKSASEESALLELEEKKVELDKLKHELQLSIEESKKDDLKKEEILKAKKSLEEEKSKYDLLSNSLKNEKANLDKLNDDEKRFLNQYNTILENEKEMEGLKDQVIKLPIFKDFKESFIEFKSLERDLDILNENIQKIESNEEALIQEKESHDNYSKLDSEISVLVSKQSEINGEIKHADEYKTAKAQSVNKIKKFNEEIGSLSQKISDAFSKFDRDIFGRYDLMGHMEILDDEGISLIDSREKFEELKDIIANLKTDIEEVTDIQNKLIADLNSEINSLNEGIKSSKKPLKEIKEVGNKCPICQSDISDDKKEELIASYESVINQNSERISIDTSKINDLKKDVDVFVDYQKDLREIESDILSKNHVFRSIEEEETNISDLNEKLEGLKKLESELSALTLLIEEKSKEHAALKVHYDKYIQAEAALKSLGDKEKIKISIDQLTENISSLDEKINECITKEDSLSLDMELDALNKRIAELEKNNLRYVELEASIKDKDDVKTQLDTTKSDVETKTKEILKIENDIESSGYDEGKYEEISNLEKAIDEKIRNNLEAIGIMRGEMGKIEPRIDELQDYLKYLEDLKKEISNLEEYINLLQEFRLLYSKNGIQSQLRAIAKPVIQSNTKMFFEKFNFNYSDLLISDDFEVSVFGPNGEANINMVSGGEKIAIALALRLGITQAIAQGNIDSILLDEPTIHLDTVRIQELSNLLRSMNIIPQMIIVTHDHGLESSADDLIKIVKEEGTSKIED